MTAPETASLDEILLRPCSPSALARRDEGIVRDGAPAADIADAKAAVAALGLAQAPSPPPAGLRGRLLSSLARQGRFGRFADRLARLYDLPIQEAERLVAQIEDPAAWQPFFVPGVQMIAVVPGPKYAGSIGAIAKLDPGARFPEHTHGGHETMLLLEGGFREEGELGEEVWRGDELLRTEGTGHAFVALPGGPCIAASLAIGSVDFT